MNAGQSASKENAGTGTKRPASSLVSAAVARVAWCLPFILCFFPEQLRDETPRMPGVRPVHLLLDDSLSMAQRVWKGGPVRTEVAQRLVNDARSYCLEAGCEVKVTTLGSLDPETPEGKPPSTSRIGAALHNWWLGTAGDPWILVSDGGDALAASGETMRSTQNSSTGPGLVLGFQSGDPRNLYFDSVAASPYAFEGRPMTIDVQLGRGDGLAASKDLPRETVQVQVRSGSQVLSVAEVLFPATEPRAGAKLVVPALARGEQPLEMVILPSPAESMVWDNIASLDVEVLPNTLGLLHLLGAPGWDGRFLRRLVKSEPKFDQISFFILRDPWDNLEVPDRELSLIPFPAERLFNEELQSFRVLILQDFTLGQFLQPEYQANLVQFVKNGGGLLFMGGPRALLRLDLSSSPLREILPFSPGVEALINPARQESDGDPAGPVEGQGAGYSAETGFRVEFATPSADKRDLVSVYDDWRQGAAAITHATGLRGLHIIPQALVDESRSTPLLNARLPDGQKVPLALATFPGRGRALWMLSDSFWRLTLSGQAGVPRETYDRFLMAALHWLLRQDLRKPAVASRLAIWSAGKSEEWSVNLSGPAVRHFDLEAGAESGKRWQVKLCGAIQNPRAVTVERTAPDQILLSGKVAARAQSGKDRPFCRLEVEGQDRAFGSVKAFTSAFVQMPLSDNEALDSISWLRRLEDQAGASLVLVGQSDPYLSADAASSRLGRWLREKAGRKSPDNELAVDRARETPLREDPYWPFKHWWSWALMAMLPVEVLLRRWWAPSVRAR